MLYYKTKIQYEGTIYSGFQWQNEILTVQGELNNALSKLIAGKFSTMAASRTDTGVHAFEQVVKITSSLEISLGSVLEDFNNFLPPKIGCLSFETCQGNFKPSIALSKEYRYFFTNQIQSNQSAFVSNIANNLNSDLMKECVNILIGENDFCNFYSSGSNVKSTVRQIIFCELTEVNPHEILSDSKLFQLPADLTKCWQLKIEANGFLKQMIRHIVSALWMVGSGKLSVEEFNLLLKGPRSSKQNWKVAPPNGLFLYKINY